MSGAFEQAVAAAVSRFGAEVKPKLRGPGGPEDQLRAPFEGLIQAVGAALGFPIVMHGEVPLVHLDARPDYAVDVADALTGYVELKRPGLGADPDGFTGRNAVQWSKLRLLPNVLYTDGNEWGLYRNGRRAGDLASVVGKVQSAGARLAPRNGDLAHLLHDFLTWKPVVPRNVGQLVRAVAGLCQLLRAEVQRALELEAAGQRAPLLSVVADGWRRLLFPGASDEAFADQYAQTVTFALLLARVEGITFDGRDVTQIARLLGKRHLLMGSALAALTDDVLSGLSTTLQTLVRVIGAVDWARLDDGSGEAYLRLYEDFLAVYDPELRKTTGSYYTPNDVVRFMVSFVEEILRTRLRRPQGFASTDVVVVDPAMGTGTFLLNVIERASQVIRDTEGPGQVGPRLRELLGERLVGFEKQAGPYAVAELRLYEALRRAQSDAPAGGLRIYVTDTLANPRGKAGWLPLTYKALAESRKKADQVKNSESVLVVLGNPPYDAVTAGAGEWIERGDRAQAEPPPLDAFRAEGNGRYESVLSNLHAYFWRWATWKVFDRHPECPEGVVAFITPSAYLKSIGFAGMREYLRRTADEGWIIDVSPEGHTPDVPTRVFPGVRQPLCIGIFVRSGPPSPEIPARIQYTAVEGRRAEKFAGLRTLTPDGGNWSPCATGWRAALLPAGSGVWEASPLLSDLMPWSSRGVTPGRVWVYAPTPSTLTRRWNLFLAAGTEARREMFREARDRKLTTDVAALPGVPEHHGALADEHLPHPAPVRVAYRSFDRQWLIPDSRLMEVPRPDLWRVRSDGQIFVSEQNAHPITGGPALVFTALIPDMHHYNGRSGCVRPLYRDAVASAPNVAPRLLQELRRRLGIDVSEDDLLAYIAAVAAHPAYTECFAEDLQVPGVRVPLTASPELWLRAVALGRRCLWLHTYGERFVDPGDGRPAGPPMLPPSSRPLSHVEIPDSESGMPDEVRYDYATETLHVGTGQIGPVRAATWAYQVSGMPVVRKWFGYRKRNPAGRRLLQLDREVATTWAPNLTTELLELLNVLTMLIELEPEQRDLLDEIRLADCITVDDLATAAVFPVPAHARKPLPQTLQGLF
ncbi:type ISP restriction/modification enzyme [Yinghuangia sp. YIM S09857]|uniref:type ISP restriction/modification enzyme n=1 Tax=Yinghuangia sp. YIM S09857 TaxID=3436929 RepID=UPI003F539BDC